MSPFPSPIRKLPNWQHGRGGARGYYSKSDGGIDGRTGIDSIASRIRVITGVEQVQGRNATMTKSKGKQRIKNNSVHSQRDMNSITHTFNLIPNRPVQNDTSQLGLLPVEEVMNMKPEDTIEALNNIKYGE